jgi:Uma2 family endonuclease
MSVSANSPCASERSAVPPEPVLPLTVEQYHEMARAGILVDGDRIELLEGWLVGKMTKDPPHVVSVGCIHDYLRTLVGEAWHVRIEGPVTTGDSEPEPDISVVRGQRRDFADRHPGPEDVVLLIEVADTSLDRDRGWKKRIYAAANIPVYWVVNLVDRQVEVFTRPTGPGSQPTYASAAVFPAEDSVPVEWDGRQVGRIAVRDLLP